MATSSMNETAAWQITEAVSYHSKGAVKDNLTWRFNVTKPIGSAYQQDGLQACMPEGLQGTVDEVIQLSERYIRTLARDSEGVVDGPYAGRFTAYDLKKTMAVLLENMIERLDRIEHRLNISSNLTKPSLSGDISMTHSLYAKDLINGEHELCALTDKERQLYPKCEQKIEWMKNMWQSDPCYASFGVDGSTCSFIMFLSESDPCYASFGVDGSTCSFIMFLSESDPCYASFGVDGSTCSFIMFLSESDPCNTSFGVDGSTCSFIMFLSEAKINHDLEGLMKLLVDPNERQGYAWMRMRIKRIWPRWETAVKSLAAKQDLTKRKQKKILVHLGLLSKQSGWKFAEMQFKGGPLGELVQWSDLITALYVLGHELTITSEVEQLANIVSQLPAANSPCQSLRVVDSFGTEPGFNLRTFAKQRKKLSSWGGQDLNPQQFFTMFPHSPDNSFMGFVVERHLNESNARAIQRSNMALVYGKNDYMWAGKEEYLNTVNKSEIVIHGTVYSDSDSKSPLKIPSYVINHGILNGEDLHKLLRQSKIFLGLGFPYEGPAPLEAIANGAFIGEPHVYTINIEDPDEVRTTVQKILDMEQFNGFLPYEFTEEGFIQRMNAYIEHQNFCQFQRQLNKWPPESAVKVLFGDGGKSCKDVCWEKNLICEPSHFLAANSHSILMSRGAACAANKTLTDIYYPALDTKTNDCIIQQEELLFSCVGKQDNLRRLCPCRNYFKGQSALCVGCEL
ncbi:MGT5A-like protein [Mya arenaria]|uniref:alpha-1,6-mannosyl-glycoprotein 6-beta-N-acetylglucosaminyltransferase n=1 Tax=Mya arenaria TaxID=6604 RepID=A0ABY7EL61_MYAAR|nr:MGT5A-like protein [Mya arenaria]